VKNVLFGGITLLSLCGAAHADVNLPAEDQAMQAADCRDQWTKRGELDDQMYRFCVKRAHEGYLDFVHAINEYKNERRLVNFVQSKWTKRGIRNDALMGFEMKMQIDKFS
jgi:hypothetical protein